MGVTTPAARFDLIFCSTHNATSWKSAPSRPKDGDVRDRGSLVMGMGNKMGRHCGNWNNKQLPKGSVREAYI